ncbi:MAG: hypothetical protein K1X29_08510 [Bdellovibrionales bacterium]|nr:hypothetical protein [Bdellovibrionales bacterium]
MEKAKGSEFESDKAKSLSHALSILNEAADDSAQEIRRMVNSDYEKLRDLFDGTKPKIKRAFGEIKGFADESIHLAKDKVVTTAKGAAENVDESVHQQPWMYLGCVAATSVLAGFLLGRNSVRVKHGTS